MRRGWHQPNEEVGTVRVGRGRLWPSAALVLLVLSCSVVSDSLQPHGLLHARLPCPFTISQSLLKLMSIELVMPSNHLILCHRLLLPPSIFPSIRVPADWGPETQASSWVEAWNSACLSPSSPVEAGTAGYL